MTEMCQATFEPGGGVEPLQTRNMSGRGGNRYAYFDLKVRTDERADA